MIKRKEGSLMRSNASIFEVIQENQLEKLEEHLKNKESIHLLDSMERSPLMHAVLANNLAMTGLLIEAGANPNQKDATELSPFIAAAANGFDEVFQLLLTAQPELTSVNRFGGTALLPSSEKGYLKTVQLAIGAGVPVNHVNRLGWSALLEAVILGDGGFLYQDVIRTLVAGGADIYQEDDEKQHSLDYAKKRGQKEIVALLEQTDADGYEQIRTSIRQNDWISALAKLYVKIEEPKKQFYLGYVFEQLKNYEQSRYYYQKGAQTEIQFYFYLAILERKLGHKQAALSYFDKGAKQDQGIFFSYHKSNYLRELGEHEAAIEVMDTLLKKNPNRVDYMFHKANSLRSIGKLQLAVETLEQAAQLVPENELYQEQAEQVKKIIVQGE